MDKSDCDQKNTTKKNSKTITFIFLITATMLSIFALTYYLYSNKSYTSYEKNLKIAIKNITKINASMDCLNNGQTIKSDKAALELPDKINSLIKVQNNIKQLNPTEKYMHTQENLLNGLENNILMYKQITSILNNPQGNDLDSSLNNIETYKNQCINFYAAITNKKLHISLPEKSVNFIDNTTHFISQLIKVKKDTDLSQRQNEEFIRSLEDILSQFVSIKTNFYPYALKARDHTETYDYIITLINKNSDEVKNIKVNFANLTVPAKSSDIHNSFKNIIENYDLYLESITFALNTEKVQAKNTNALYINANKKFDELEKDYEHFEKLFKKYKQSN